MDFTKGYAKNHSVACEEAMHSVYAAQDRLLETMKAKYPMGCPVLVVHHRGCYHGVVAGWDVFGARISVRNDRTGKEQKWWFHHVERS